VLHSNSKAAGFQGADAEDSRDAPTPNAVVESTPLATPPAYHWTMDDSSAPPSQLEALTGTPAADTANRIAPSDMVMTYGGSGGVNPLFGDDACDEHGPAVAAAVAAAAAEAEAATEAAAAAEVAAAHRPTAVDRPAFSEVDASSQGGALHEQYSLNDHE